MPLTQIAPDLTASDKRDIAAVALRTGIDGLIISNTTITRPGAVETNPLAQEVCVCGCVCIWLCVCMVLCVDASVSVYTFIIIVIILSSCTCLVYIVHINYPPSSTTHPHQLPTRNTTQAGGLSGAPLMALSTEVLSEMYTLTKGKIPLIGCGGVSSGEDAYRKIRAGASLVELYTAFAYEGPRLVPRIKRELAACLARDGFSSVAQAVGADHKRR